MSDRPKFDVPAKGPMAFRGIVPGIAHAHMHAPPIYHLDLKPENILLKGEKPVAGDFGICFVEED